MNPDIQKLEQLCRKVRALILKSTTAAQSGHATSSLSAVELMVALMFGGLFRANLEDPSYPNNDRLIFSKGHAAPLLYALYAIAGELDEDDLSTLRQFDSALEGHPSMRFPFTEAATGSLGQGLSIGLGMALNARYIDHLPYRTYVLLGDSELSEGANWEAIQLAEHYQLNGLIGILDVNRLGQRGETMVGHNIQKYQQRLTAFGWKTIVIEDGHNLQEVIAGLNKIPEPGNEAPIMVIAKTIKGKGVKFWEDQNNWHSKQLNQQQLQTALQELGSVDDQLQAEISQPEIVPTPPTSPQKITLPYFDWGGESVTTKKAVAVALAELSKQDASLICLDAEVSNSTHFDLIQQAKHEQFFEMFVAEQNMVGTAVGLARRGKLPVVSTFAAFMTRAFDQIRMAQYSDVKIIYAGSYAGVSLGKDGFSQMGLEDIAMFRTLQNCAIVYPSDAISSAKLTETAVNHKSSVYIRTTREPTPIIYPQDQAFYIGGSNTLRSSDQDEVTIVGAGITVHEALTAYDQLLNAGINARIIDLYSIEPIDQASLSKAAKETTALIVVEDHYAEGGIAEAVRTSLRELAGKVHSLAVTKMPRSGTPEELLAYEQIDANAVVLTVKKILRGI